MTEDGVRRAAAAGRRLRPADPANNSPIVVALCADEAQDITGQVFFVYGGAVNMLRGWEAGELFSADEPWDADALLRAQRALARRRRAAADARRHARRRRPVDARE